MIDINLTANEIDVLNGIAYHEMGPANGSKPKAKGDTGTFCWADDFSATLAEINKIAVKSLHETGAS